MVYDTGLWAVNLVDVKLVSGVTEEGHEFQFFVVVEGIEQAVAYKDLDKDAVTKARNDLISAWQETFSVDNYEDEFEG